MLLADSAETRASASVPGAKACAMRGHSTENGAGAWLILRQFGKCLEFLLLSTGAFRRLTADFAAVLAHRTKTVGRGQQP